jgi:hypothetical protein
MRIISIVAILVTLASRAAAQEDIIERFSDHLAVSAFNGNARAKLRGLLDFEGYVFQQPPPGLLFTDKEYLVNPRLTLFLDAQLGRSVYAFAQARLDRGFDPSESDAEVRLDEYALRVSPWKDGRLSVQFGRFATIVGNWVPRHSSWENPFVTAPVPYENVTGIWDSGPADSTDTLLYWGHVPTGKPGGFEVGPDEYSDKYLRTPIVWGPSYATGVSVFGRLGKFEYAAEMKNAGLSSRPESWDLNEVGFDHPAFSTRFGFRPNPTWNFGVSGSVGTYLLPTAEAWLPVGKDIDDYRQLVLAQDVSFEWHHLQVWAEFYETRFEIPFVADADTFAYYVESKYKLTPQFFGALRWNQQLFGTVRDGDTDRPWGRDLWRIDSAVGYRFTAHTQLKLQYSLEHEAFATRGNSHTFAGQVTVQF